MGIGAWDAKSDEACKEIKLALIHAPTSVAPNWVKPFTFHVGTSQFAVGGTMTQEDEYLRTRVIAYTSKQMTPAEQIYTASDKKLVYGLHYFRCYLEGTTFSLIADIQVVSHFFSKAKFKLGKREARWLETSTNFNISELKLKAGRMNMLGDALSMIIQREDTFEHGSIDVLQVD